MPGWNFADAFEVVAERIPDAQAQKQGERRITWGELNRRANGVAQHLLDRGVDEQDKVAQYLHNCPEYMESMFASFKAGLVPINTNYRYADDELVYLWTNADCVAVVFHGTFIERIERVRGRVPLVQTWLYVADESGVPCPEWAVPYETVADGATSTNVAGPWGRDGDHLLMLYTGGTTGMPKGVMWRQDDLLRNLGGSVNPRFREDPVDYSVVAAGIGGPGIVNLPACPLMHGTGMFTQLMAYLTGGSTVTLESRNLDIVEILDTIEREKVNQLTVVGDAFAKPILRELDANEGRWDLSSLVLITSSGVMFSEESKQGLLRHNPTMMIVDALSSSEALGMGQSVSTAAGASHTAAFMLGENTRVITENGRAVEPGSGEIGRLAVGGFQPIGYYKDPEKSAATFITFEGRRFSCPGDFAQVEADGTITLLGRGSVCINTGGEKVFPEEVEEVMKTHPAVLDAVAVGIPDEKFGEAITAVVEARAGTDLDPADLVAHVKARLASFKVPKHVVRVDTIGRAPNGKVDYKRLKAYAMEALGS